MAAPQLQAYLTWRRPLAGSLYGLNKRKMEDRYRAAADVVPAGAGQMAIDIGRRQFISALGGLAVAWPLARRAQQSVPVVGFLRNTLPDSRLMTAFRKGLSEIGYVEDRI